MSIRVRHTAEVTGGIQRAPRFRETDKHSTPAPAELENFKRLLETAMSSSAPRARIPATLELGGADRLAEMIEAVREALLVCVTGLEDCNWRTRRHWRQAQASRQRGCLCELDLEKSALQSEAASWGEKIRWLQELLLCLKREQARDQTLLLSGSESGRACA